jgi:hypothetical protein
MTEQTGTFNAIGNSDQRMYGKTALLVAGYDEADQLRLHELLKTHALDTIPVICVNEERADMDLASLAALGSTGTCATATPLRRAMIMSGLTEVELHSLMKVYREAGLPHQLWASVTPVSAEWSLRSLLNELGKEKEELRKAVQAQREKQA